MIDADPIIARLVQAGFKRVQGVIEWAGLKSAPAHSPALFVIPDSDSAADNELVGVHDQRVAEKFRVILVLKPAVRADGKPSKELKVEVDRIRGVIAGWHHPDASKPCNYAGSKLLSADGWGVAVAVDFRTSWRFRKGNQ